MANKTKNASLMLVLLLIPVALSVPLVLGFFGRFHPALDSFAHFRAHIAIAMALSALPLFFVAMKREALMILLLALTALSSTLSPSPFSYLTASNADAEPPQEMLAEYRLLQLNLRFDNPDQAGVLRLIARENADIITFEEVSESWLPKLKLVESRYPYRVDCSSDRAVGGVAILSRRPFVEGAPVVCDDRNALAIADIDLGGQSVRVAAIHLRWPWPFDQAQQLADMLPHLTGQQKPLVIAGDFNAAPWSQTLRVLSAETGTRRVAGLTPSWIHHSVPVSLARWVGLPIDHILASDGVISKGAEMLSPVGSDHLPVRFRFSLPKKPAAPDGE